MDQSGELVDSLSQSLLRAQIAHQGDHLPDHQKGVPVPGVVAGRARRLGSPGRCLALPENEIERGGTGSACGIKLRAGAELGARRS